jgi:hypothetical protein
MVEARIMKGSNDQPEVPPTLCAHCGTVIDYRLYSMARKAFKRDDLCANYPECFHPSPYRAPQIDSLRSYTPRHDGTPVLFIEDGDIVKRIAQEHGVRPSDLGNLLKLRRMSSLDGDD